MPAGAESGLAANLVWVLGWTGVAIFYARFYIQWIASELKKRVVIPVAFWYMSVVGSVFQFIFGACIRSPMGTLGQTFNLAVYARNLVHIWREKGTLSRRKAIAINTAAAAIVLLMLSVYGSYMVCRVPAQPDARHLATGPGSLVLDCRRACGPSPVCMPLPDSVDCHRDEEEECRAHCLLVREHYRGLSSHGELHQTP